MLLTGDTRIDEGIHGAMAELSFYMTQFLYAMDKYSNGEEYKELISNINKLYRTEADVYHFWTLVHRLANSGRPVSLWRREDVDNILGINFLNKLDDYGWNNSGKRYMFVNECLNNTRDKKVCKDLSHFCNLDLASDNNGRNNLRNILQSLHKIFIYGKHSNLVCYFFSYALSSLFVSLLLNANRNKHIPFYLQVAVDKDSSFNALIREIWNICDVNLAIDLRDCVCGNKDKHGCVDVPYIYRPAFDLSNDILCLRHNSDVPVIIDSRVKEDRRFYKNIIRQFARYGFHKINTMPVFVTDDLVIGCDNIVSIDLRGVELEDEYLKLIRENKGLLSALVYDFIVDCVRVGKAGFKFYNSDDRYIDEFYDINKDPSLVILSENLSLFTHNTKLLHYDDITEKDIYGIFALKTFFESFMSSFNERIIGYRNNEAVKEEHLFNASKMTLGDIFDTFLNKVYDNICAVHMKYSPTAHAKQDIFGESDVSEKRKQEINSLITELEDICSSLDKVSFEVKNAIDKNGIVVLNIKLTKNSTKKDLLNKCADISHRLEKNVFPKVRGTNIELIITERRNDKVNLIKLLTGISTEDYTRKMVFPVLIGENVYGEPYITNFGASNFSHLLIGGKSGAGKSSALRAFVANIIYFQNPNEVKLILMDVKANQFEGFADVDFLGYHPVSQKIDETLHVLKQLENEMNSRYERMINGTFKDEPKIICVIDEFDLLLKKETKAEAKPLLENLLKRARESGIHFVIATSNPSMKNIDCDMTNVSASIALSCHNFHHSRNIIGIGGAEHLQGNGDMLFNAPNGELERIQGALIDEKEVKEFVKTYKTGVIEYIISPPSDSEIMTQSISFRKTAEEELLVRAICFVLNDKKYRRAALLGYLHIGDKNVALITDKLHNLGIIDKDKIKQGSHGQLVTPTLNDLTLEARTLLERFREETYVKEAYATLSSNETGKVICHLNDKNPE